jgi:hypothetical protein
MNKLDWEVTCLLWLAIIVLLLMYIIAKLRKTVVRTVGEHKTVIEYQVVVPVGQKPREIKVQSSTIRV